MDNSAKTSGAYDALLQFLERPEAYPHHPDSVKHVQTHISHVFIVPPYVYKIKKPVDFDFLDYSTLDKRKHFCEQEVKLNRRLCSDIYLGVVPIARSGDRFILEADSNDNAIEYAVKMKKLGDQYFLHSFIERGSLRRQQLDRVVTTLADFYKSRKPDKSTLEFGSIDHIRYNTNENFEQTKSFIGDTIEEAAYDVINHYTNRYFEVHADLFEQRVKEKRIVDGHGDLHLEHIHITPGTVCIYDCIEFNERFRKGDVAGDLAYLAMDLDFNNCRREGRYVIEQMAEALDDADLPTIIDFYKCYRAYVKGKVKSLQSGEEEVAGQERNAARETARRYFRLALRYALMGSQPLVMIVMGRIATGKSTLARKLEQELGVARFSSDEVRKSLAGLPRNGRSSKVEREQLYTARMSDVTYGTLLEQAELYGKEGKPVIIDATFSSKEIRQMFVEKLEAAGLPYLFIEATASDEVIKGRLKAREGDPEVISDARLEDFDKLNNRYEPPSEIAEAKLLKVDTARDLPETMKGLFQAMIDRQLRE